MVRVSACGVQRYVFVSVGTEINGNFIFLVS